MPNDPHFINEKPRLAGEGLDVPGGDGPGQGCAAMEAGLVNSCQTSGSQNTSWRNVLIICCPVLAVKLFFFPLLG